ncbi:MAG: NAD(P)-dependent oxidoreductase, partial [Planctomycetota bacterium]
MKQRTPITLCQLVCSATALGALILSGCATSSGAPVPPAVGSLEGARVAVPTEGGQRELLFLARRMEPAELAAFDAAAANVRCVVPSSEEEALRLAPLAHGADGRLCTPEFLAAAEQLVWIQSPSAGVAWLLEREGVREREEIVVTNMQAVHGPAIAEHVFGMLLTLTRDIGFHQHPDQRGAWHREGSGREAIALSGRTMLVVGLGGIGREVARRAHGFDMEVLATRRSRKEAPDYVDRQGTGDDLEEMLPEADVVGGGR